MGEGEGIGLRESREQAVRAELDRLLESPAFRTSKRCKEFLEYIVEQTMIGQSGALKERSLGVELFRLPTDFDPGQQTMIGQSGALKERSLGVELFRLPTDFDPGQHTIVRVTANEVRKKLAQHYLSLNGAPHPVRIDLPPGSYRAEFRWEVAAEPAPALAADNQVAESHAAEPTAEAPAQAPTVAESRILTRPGGFTTLVIACAMAVVLTAGAFLSWGDRPKPVSAGATSSSVSGAFPNALVSGEDLRMIVGSTGPFIDRSGRTWGPDSFFSGGSVLVRSSARILRTLDPDIYRRERQGDFRYDIPLRPGSYELRLHF